MIDLIAEVADVARIGWNVSEAGQAHARQVLAVAAHPEHLEVLLRALPSDPGLVMKCERKPYQDKLVLYHGGEDGTELVLHRYRHGHADRGAWIHNHRADFAAFIVAGGYTHVLYSVKDWPDDPADRPYVVSELYRRDERAGDSYVLGRRAFHTVRAEADTVTLVLRGAPVAERPLYVSNDGRRHFWRDYAGVQDAVTRSMQRPEVPGAIDEVLGIMKRKPIP